MSIPQIPQFENFLREMTVRTPQNTKGYKSTVSIPEQEGLNHKNQRVRFDAVKLWYKVNGNFDLDSLISKMQMELKKLEHANGRNTVLAVLSAYATLPKDNGNEVNRLNAILASTIQADIVQILVFPISASRFIDFRFGSFRIGSLDKRNLAQKVRLAESDYYELYHANIDDKLAIERDIAPIQIIDWSLFRNGPISTRSGEDTLAHFMDSYFSNLALEANQEFWNLFDREQDILVPAGGTYIDSLMFQRMSGIQGLAVFLNIGITSPGWVVPNVVQTIIDFGGADKTFRQVESLLYRHGFSVKTTTQPSELNNLIKMFGRFVTRAKKHSFSNADDESFLHYVIALDLLLGEKDASTKTISERVATLVHNHFKNSFKEQRRIVLGLYDRRSKYVHDGKHVEETDLKIVASICQEVFMCLLRCNAKPENHTEEFVEQWLKNLDFIQAAINANQILKNHNWLICGIEPPTTIQEQP